MSDPLDTPILLCAYGNPSRRDDGLGPALAERYLSRQGPDFTVSIQHQLFIEDAVRLSDFAAVIFTDAAVEGDEPYAFQPVAPASSGTLTSHQADPGVILYLARSLYGADTKAYLLTIRGYDFDGFGETLSPEAEDNLAQAAAFLDSKLPPST